MSLFLAGILPVLLSVASKDLATEELLKAEQNSQICSGANMVGSGLHGDYYEQTNFHGKVVYRMDSTLDFSKDLDWSSSLGKPPKSVRWTGWIRTPLSGKYSFHFDWPNARVQISGQDLLGGSAKHGASIDLSAGRFYPITVELPDATKLRGPARLEWTGPHGLRFPMPRQAFFPPSDKVGSVK